MSVAVISLGGKQFTISLGKIISVPHLREESGATLNLTDLLSGGKVTAQILNHYADKKIRVVKFKNKVRYTRTIGHRSKMTKVRIDSIED